MAKGANIIAECTHHTYPCIQTSPNGNHPLPQIDTNGNAACTPNTGGQLCEYTGAMQVVVTCKSATITMNYDGTGAGTFSGSNENLEAISWVWSKGGNSKSSSGTDTATVQCQN